MKLFLSTGDAVPLPTEGPQPDREPTRPPQSWSFWRTTVLVALLVSGVETLLLFSSPKVLRGYVFDPDCYMHLQRAARLMTTGGWRTLTDYRIDAPFGYAIHWTVLFDALLVAGAMPLHWLLGWDAHHALLVWGSVVSPVLFIVGLVTLLRAARNWLPGPSQLLLVALAFTQPQFAGSFLVGRPDHHSLILALVLAQLAWLYAWLGGRLNANWAFVAGAAAGLEMCTSVEGLLTILWVGIALGLAWSLYRAPVLRGFANYLLGCVVVIAGWLALTRGPQFFEIVYDRVSFVHLLALGSGAVSFLAISFFYGGKPVPSSLGARIAPWLAAASVSAVVTAVSFPDFFLGPWPHPAAAIVAWHKTVNEIQPLLPTNLVQAGLFLGQFTAALASLPVAIHLLRKGSRAQRLAMLVSLVGLVLFGGIALAQMRWAAEAQAMILLPWTCTALRIMQSDIALPIGAWRIPVRSFVLVALLALPIVAAIPAQRATAPLTGPATANRSCAWDQASQALKPYPGGKQPIVLAPVWYGPEILWRTTFRVVGVPYEIPSALGDTQDFFRDEMAAKRVAAARHVDFVLVCGADGSGPFESDLVQGRHPGWLKPLAADSASPGFRLYRVVLAAPYH